MSEPSPSSSAARADAMIAWFRSYAERRLNFRVMDERRTIPPYVVLDLGAQGFMGLQVEEAMGGRALDTVDMIRVFEQVAAVDVTLAAFLGLHNGLGVRPVQGFAPPELRETWLPVLASGRQLAAFALTEHGAGSNPAAIAAVAHRVPGGWRVTAHKHWIGLGAWAGLMVVVARAVDEAGKGLRHIALAVPADQPGLHYGEEALTLGLRSIVQNEIRLEDAFVPDSHVLGRPGAGMAVGQDAMMISRLGIASTAVGAMRRGVQLMVRYASRRTVATGRLLDNAVTLDVLESAISATEAAGALVARVAALVDAGEAPKAAYLVCKTTAPELLAELLDDLTQLLGGRGYIETDDVPRYVRDARILRIFEGPTEPLLSALGASAIARPSTVTEFVGQKLGGEAIAADAVAACAELVTRYAALPFADDAHRAQWAEQRAGAIVNWASLVAAAAGTGAEAWARRRYAADTAAALTWQGPLSPPEDLLARAARCTAAIGDVEPTLPSEATHRDPYLARDWTET